jgi:hypothetical protein
MKVINAFVLLMLITTNTHGATSFGTPDCGQWFSENTKAPAKIWLIGYLSGINALKAIPGADPLDRINSAEQVFLWMDKWCQANPLKTVYIGGQDLYLELAKNIKKP